MCRMGLTTTVYVGAPTNGMSVYDVYTGLQAPDGNKITVNITGRGQCLAVQWNMINTYIIVDSTICSGLGPWLCESGKIKC